MKILHFIGDRSGIFLYRCYFPSIAIQDNTKNNVIISKDCNIRDAYSLLLMNWADIIVFHRQHTAPIIEAAKYLKKCKKKIVYEVDDDWLHLNDDNLFAGMMKEKGVIDGFKTLMGICDAVTVTNERLKNVMLQFNKNIYVIPNYISEYFFNYRSESKPKDEKEVSLFWAGAQNHLDSMKELTPALELLFKRYDNINFFNIGHYYGDLYPFIPKKKKMWVPWKGIEEYVHNFNFADIVLAPMADNLFNASKSNIRILEASYFKLPVVASDIYAYGETIEQEYNGFKAKDTDEWVKYLSMLIECKQLRDNIGANAKKFVEGQTIEKNYHKWLDAYEDILNG